MVAVDLLPIFAQAAPVLGAAAVAVLLKYARNYLAAKVGPTRLAAVADLARTGVQAAEQFGFDNGLDGPAKYKAAEHFVVDGAARVGLHVTEAEAFGFIHSALSELKQLGAELHQGSAHPIAAAVQAQAQAQAQAPEPVVEAPAPVAAFTPLPVVESPPPPAPVVPVAEPPAPVVEPPVIPTEVAPLPVDPVPPTPEAPPVPPSSGPAA